MHEVGGTSLSDEVTERQAVWDGTRNALAYTSHLGCVLRFTPPVLIPRHDYTLL